MLRVAPYGLLLLLAVALAPGCERGPRASPATENHQDEKPRMAAMTDTFSMQDYAWSHRPLLVFAPSPDHELVRAQRARVEAVAEGFEERDMIFIAVYDDVVEVEEVRLDGESAAALRDRFNIERGEAAVLLVGKDTGVKRRSAEAVAMQDIFAQVDSMPMRQQEMRRQR